MSEDSSEEAEPAEGRRSLTELWPFCRRDFISRVSGQNSPDATADGGFRWKSPAARQFCLLFFLQLHVGKSWQPEVRASELRRRLSSSRRRPARAHPRGSGLWESHLWPSVTGRTSTLSADTDSLGLALPVAFGCHGSKKR